MFILIHLMSLLEKKDLRSALKQSQTLISVSKSKYISQQICNYLYDIDGYYD